MDTRAAQLAASFERANDAVIAAIEGCSESQLRAACDGETWPVVVTAHHVAVTYPAFADMVRRLANGEPLPALTMEQLDGANAQHADQSANVSREETVGLLRQEGAAVANVV